MQTPIEKLFHETPDYIFLKVFLVVHDSLTFPLQRKHEFRSKKCVFLRYNSLHKGYKCLHIFCNCMYISRDVFFQELFRTIHTLP
jgi:hypothetical protein